MIKIQPTKKRTWNDDYNETPLDQDFLMDISFDMVQLIKTADSDFRISRMLFFR